jgi:Putative amidoligase enzyme
MNLIERRLRGQTASDIRWIIRNQLQGSGRPFEPRHSRLGYYHTSASVLRAQQARLRQAGRELGIALRAQSENMALHFIHDYWDDIDRSCDWVDWLAEHFGGDYFQCNDCSEIGYYDDSSNVEDDYRVCSDCCNNYYYSERRGYYCRDDNDDDYDDDYGGYDNIGSRHSSKRRLGHIPSNFDKRKPRVLLGLELEMEISESLDLGEKAGELLECIGSVTSPIDNSIYQYCLLEEDGSINNGFEMVTGFTGLDIHRKQLGFFRKKFSGAKSHNTTTCGLHVHICKSDMSMLHAAKMILFINDPCNASLVKTIARRDASNWAKIQNKKDDKHWLKDALRSGSKADKLRHLNNDRYEALNFQNDRTIEFRIFKGTLKYSTIMACLEFTYACWFFCRDTSQARLTTSEFLQFICLENNRKDTSYLRAYLGEKGFALPYTSKPRPVAYGGASQAANTTSEEI